MIAAILVRTLSVPQLWIRGLKIMNQKHTNELLLYELLAETPCCYLSYRRFIDIFLQPEVSQQSALTKMAAVS